MRLGLLLSEIGQSNGVEVSGQEMSMLIQQAAQQYRAEDRERFIQYVQQEPMAAAQLRAPLYEDKVVDFLFDKAEVTEREVSREELEAAIEADEDAEEAKKPVAKKKAPAKKAAAKKGDDKPSEDEQPVAKKAPAKKAAPKKEAAEAEAVKKPAAKKAPAKKAPAKAADAEKPAAKKAPAKKPAAKK